MKSYFPEKSACFPALERQVIFKVKFIICSQQVVATLRHVKLAGCTYWYSHKMHIDFCARICFDFNGGKTHTGVVIPYPSTLMSEVSMNIVTMNIFWCMFVVAMELISMGCL
ncbi:uncharacterized protein LOC144364981 [Ictidomys tridecemlineatus]